MARSTREPAGQAGPHGNRSRAGILEPRRPRLTIALLVCLAAACGREPATTSRPSPWTRPPDAVAIDAAIRFTGTQFVVENQGRDLWRQVEVRVARDDDLPAFRYDADAILGGRSVTVGALNFARPDGIRLSPFRLQPERWSVSVALPDGARGFAEGRF